MAKINVLFKSKVIGFAESARAGLPEKIELTHSGDEVDISSLSILEPEELRELDLSDFGASGQTLRDLADKHFGLEVLRFNNRKTYRADGTIDNYGNCILDHHAISYLLQRIKRLKKLGLRGTFANDQILMALSELCELELLDLSSTDMSHFFIINYETGRLDEDHRLRNLKKLKYLDLSKSHADFSAVRNCGSYFSALEYLDVSFTAVSDTCFIKGSMSAESWFPNLKKLCLAGKTITDKLIDSIQELPTLEELKLRETSITEAAIRKLKEKRKSLKIS